jgi:hypothetical protein
MKEKLPYEDAFYSKINNENVSDEDYEFSLDV